MQQTELHLASSSPRRREILSALGVRYSHAGVDVDETPLPGEQAMEMAQRLAATKAAAGRRNRDCAVLGADTAVTIDDRILGKPVSGDDALAMLLALSGRTHRVVTAVALDCGHDVLRACSVTSVTFREIVPDEALRYWQSGEPSGKAGAYAVQGLGGIFVERLSGSYSGVVGLPVFETAALLRRAGIDPLAKV